MCQFRSVEWELAFGPVFVCAALCWARSICVYSFCGMLSCAVMLCWVVWLCWVVLLWFNSTAAHNEKSIVECPMWMLSLRSVSSRYIPCRLVALCCFGSTMIRAQARKCGRDLSRSGRRCLWPHENCLLWSWFFCWMEVFQQGQSLPKYGRRRLRPRS